VEHALERWIKHFPAYQRRWIFERSRFAACVKARQIGFSTATAAACVFSGLLERRTQLIVSASQALSDEVLKKVRDHCDVLAAGGLRTANRFRVNKEDRVEWVSGGRVIALPSNPRTARGFSGDVWLDEYAYHLDPVGISDAIRAMAIRGDFRFRAFSTPNGAQGEFYDLIASPPKGWKVHRVSVDDAIRDGFKVDRDMLFHTVAGADERLFGQWFGCQFLDADLQYFPTAIVDRALEWDGELPSLRGAEFFAGLDVGRDNDLTALTVVSVIDGIAYVVAVMTCKRTEFKAQKALIRDARRLFRWQTLHVDETGIGRQLAEELVEDFGESEVIPVAFTNQSKADMATRALRWFRDERVRFPKDDEGKALHAESIALRRVVTASGNVTYEIPRTRKGHGDRFWALALALQGAGEPQAPRGYGRSPLFAVA
jgi:phage FluMu gp28-like protein